MGGRNGPDGRLLRERHRLRAAAGRVLSVGGAVPTVEKCGRVPIASSVNLVLTEKGAYYQGLVTCGSVWVCPVCAAKIAGRRREELRAAMIGCEEEGGATYLATLTLPHRAFEKAADLRSLVAGAWRQVQAGAPWGRFKKKLGIVGTARALEVTHGAHGWHPHLHVLFFAKAKLSEAQDRRARRWLFLRWARAIEALGGGRCDRAAFDFKAARASDYLAKWGADSELAKAIGKLGRETSRTPWQLLASAAAGDGRAAELFREYAGAFKGARHLTWSKGLKARYAIDDLADEAVAEREGELAVENGVDHGVIVAFQHETWRDVRRLRLLAELLILAVAGGRAAVFALLEAHGIRSQQGDGELVDPPPQPPHHKPARVWPTPHRGYRPTTLAAMAAELAANALARRCDDYHNACEAGRV